MTRVELFSDHGIRSLVSGDHGDLVIESGGGGTPAVLRRLVTGEAIRELARLPLGRVSGALCGFDGHAIFVLDADTLVSIAIEDGRREAHVQLAPSPAAVAITPEHVVWCTRHSLVMEGGGPRSAGELWRWWRGSNHVERIGGHTGTQPRLAARPLVSPVPPDVVAPDVYVTADTALGVIELDGVRWLVEESQPIHAVVCTDAALYYITGGRVVERLHATGERRTIWRADIPLAIAVYGRRLAVTRNYVAGTAIKSAVFAVDLDTRIGRMLASGIGVPRAVTADQDGICVLEDAGFTGGLDRVSYVRWDADAIETASAALDDDEYWALGLFVSWRSADGSTGGIMVARDGTWGGGKLAMGPLEYWYDEFSAVANGGLAVTATGCVVQWGIQTWSQAAGTTSRAIEALRALLPAGSIP